MVEGTRPPVPLPLALGIDEGIKCGSEEGRVPLRLRGALRRLRVSTRIGSADALPLLCFSSKPFCGVGVALPVAVVRMLSADWRWCRTAPMCIISCVLA